MLLTGWLVRLALVASFCAGVYVCSLARPSEGGPGPVRTLWFNLVSVVAISHTVAAALLLICLITMVDYRLQMA